MVWYRQRWEASESRVFSSVGTVKNSISQRGHIREMGVICNLIWFYNFIFLRSLLPSFFHFTIKPPGDIPPLWHGAFLKQPPSISWTLKPPRDAPAGSTGDALVWCISIPTTWGGALFSPDTATSRPHCPGSLNTVPTWLGLRRNAGAGSSSRCLLLFAHKLSFLLGLTVMLQLQVTGDFVGKIMKDSDSGSN